MAMVIRYLNEDGTPVYVWKAPGSTETTLQLVAKTVPVGVAWTLIDSAEIPVDPDAFRATLNPFARAFFAALKFFPSPVPGDLHMLDTYTKAIAAKRALDPYDDLVIWNDRIVQIVRSNPDMDYFAGQFGLAPEHVDVICEVALVLEGPGTDGEKAAAIAGMLA